MRSTFLAAAVTAGIGLALVHSSASALPLAGAGGLTAAASVGTMVEKTVVVVRRGATVRRGAVVRPPVVRRAPVRRAVVVR